MKSIVKKTGKVILWIIGVIISIIILGMLIGFTLQNTYYKKQLKDIKPYGELVKVDNKNMHVYSMGSGKETIVLLPGHGVPLPVADFGPLMRELSKKYRVVTVEHFGTGFSDQTDTPRTSENYVNEMRTALDKAGVNPPYILMPHSISGIYSEYYAKKYPEEVKGLILLDSTFTTKEIDFPESVFATFKSAKIIQAIGLQRLLLSFASDEVLEQNGFAIKKSNGFMQKEIDDYKKYMCFSVNNTIIEQLRDAGESVKQVQDLLFPPNVPVLKIIAKDEVDMKEQEAHMKLLGANAKYVVLEGTHFIYYDQLKEISRLTDEFIGNLK